MENIVDFAKLGYDAITGHTGDCNFHIQGRCLKIKNGSNRFLQNVSTSLQNFRASHSKKKAVSDIYFHNQ
jgi:hypothetical protein